jgi:hypothetical protein
MPSRRHICIRGLAVAAACALLTASAAFANIKTAADPEADFSQYRTFAFRPAESIDDFLAGQIEVAAVEALAKKGLQQVGLEEEPDLWIDYAIGSGDILYADYRFELGWWNSIWLLPGGRSSVEAGILIVLSDRQEETPVWGGLAKMRGNNPNALMVMEGRVPGQVTKMMKRYPKGK